MIGDHRPLADQLRPARLDQMVGQRHLLADGKPLAAMLANGRLSSLILWGPPGTGKTTLAHLLAAAGDLHFEPLSAVMAGIKDVRQAMAEASARREQERRGTLLFIDEVHRFNKSQQDGFLPYVEDGTVVFVGATTENPSFALNNALLSRARVLLLKSLEREDLLQLFAELPARAAGDHPVRRLQLSDAQQVLLADGADGDARRFLNFVELAAQLAGADGRLTDNQLREIATAGSLRFDKGGDVFYDQISALHKAVRGSDPDAALYWLQRMLVAGCDPFYVARRILRMASEDIGNADPRALTLALDAWQTLERLGSPEGELALSQAVVFLACAAKSNAVYLAHKAARADATDDGSLEVPLHLRNATSKLTRSLGHGAQYRYAHDEPDAFAAGVNYFPAEKKPRKYYHPVPRGLEIRLAEKLEALERKNAEARHPLKKE